MMKGARPAKILGRFANMSSLSFFGPNAGRNLFSPAAKSGTREAPALTKFAAIAHTSGHVRAGARLPPDLFRPRAQQATNRLAPP